RLDTGCLTAGADLPTVARQYPLTRSFNGTSEKDTAWQPRGDCEAEGGALPEPDPRPRRSGHGHGRPHPQAQEAVAEGAAGGPAWRGAEGSRGAELRHGAPPARREPDQHPQAEAAAAPF